MTNYCPNNYLYSYLSEYKIENRLIRMYHCKVMPNYVDIY